MRGSLVALFATFTMLSACASGANTRRTPQDGGLPRDGGHDANTPLDLDAPDLRADIDLGADLDLGTDVDLGPGALDLGPQDLGAPALGPADLGPPVGCTGAASCQDGLACNGVEACIAGTCRPGTAITCDDGIACTTDSCGEPSGTCAFARNDAACPIGSTCTAPTASGCASACAESPCRLVSPQCGCAGTLACTLSGSMRLCAAAGTGATGVACGAAGAGCSAGNLCVGVSTTGTVGACEHFCNTDADCTGAGALCLLTLDDGTGAAIPGVTLCSLSCNLITNSGCPSGSACRIFSEVGGAGRDLTHCDGPVGFGTTASLCTTDADCAAGYRCVNPTGGGNECARWCDYTTGTGCGGGYTCTPFATPVVFGTREYGVCI